MVVRRRTTTMRTLLRAHVEHCCPTLGPGPYEGHLSDILVTYERFTDVHNGRHTFRAETQECSKPGKDTRLAMTFMRFV